MCVEVGRVGVGRVTNKKRYMASSDVHRRGLSDSFSVFWPNLKYYLSMVLIPASQSNG